MEENQMQSQMLDYQLKQLQQLIETLDGQLVEVSVVRASLADFKKLNDNEEMLYPIANGIFAEGKTTNNKMLKINVGNNIMVEKNIDQTIQMMEDQERDIANYKQELIAKMQELLSQTEDAQFGE